MPHGARWKEVDRAFPHYRAARGVAGRAFGHGGEWACLMTGLLLSSPMERVPIFIQGPMTYMVLPFASNMNGQGRRAASESQRTCNWLHQTRTFFAVSLRHKKSVGFIRSRLLHPATFFKICPKCKMRLFFVECYRFSVYVNLA